MWQEKYEAMDVEDIEQLQLERLQSSLNRACRSVKHYKDFFEKIGFSPEDIKDLSDISGLPFTTKDDMKDGYPYGLFSVPLRDIVRIHSSSGTTGKPTVVGYTRRDLDIWNDLVARIMTASGVTNHDIVQISFSYGLFTGGFGLHYGAEHIGASVIPVSSGNVNRQMMIMRDYRSTALVCTPSYALHLAETLKESGLTKNDIFLKYALLGSEPWGEKERDFIEENLGVIATDNYGLSELMGPGISGECHMKNGLHINEDHFYPEIIDPDTLEVLPEGEKGELVLTTLTKESMPLIRYRTRDITRIYRDKCDCGRTLIKMEKPKGRTDDMLIINGVNVFPFQVEETLQSEKDISSHFMIVVKKKGALDSMEVHLEADESLFFDKMTKQKEVLENLTNKLATALQVVPKVVLVEPKKLKRLEGASKASRVIDERP